MVKVSFQERYDLVEFILLQVDNYFVGQLFEALDCFIPEALVAKRLFKKFPFEVQVYFLVIPLLVR